MSERYGQFCPVSKAAEVLCGRWTLLIIREILCGSTRFSEIHRGVPLISPSLLAQRLRQLERAGVIEHQRSGRTSEYTPTEAGRQLEPIVDAMAEWGQRWVRSSYTPDELDPTFLMWDIRRNLTPVGLADQPVTIQFNFTGAPRGKTAFWLVVNDGIDLCLIDPGHPIDLWVRADLRALTEVWMGDRTMSSALLDGSILLSGPETLIRRFPKWLGQHPTLAQIPPVMTHMNGQTPSRNELDRPAGMPDRSSAGRHSIEDGHPPASTKRRASWRGEFSGDGRRVETAV